LSALSHLQPKQTDEFRKLLFSGSVQIQAAGQLSPPFDRLPWTAADRDHRNDSSVQYVLPHVSARRTIL
jgi:hypothetical protein